MSKCLWSAVAVAVGLMCSPTNAQEKFPSRPIRVVVPFAPGGSIDFLLRVISEKFRQSTGVPLVIDNRGGASGILAADQVRAAAPDGYTLMTATVGQMSLNPLTRVKLSYDPDRDFAPITQLVTSQYVFIGNKSVPAADLKSFVARAKANPGKVSYASTGAGLPGHFAGVMLSQAAGLELIHVAYRGGGPAFHDLLGGHVNTFFATVGIAGDTLKSGQVHVYAVTSEKRVPQLPETPTFTELGYPDVVAYVWSGLVAPAGVPQPILDKLNREFVAALKHPDSIQRLRATDQEPVGSSIGEFTAFMKADRERWRAAVKASGFQAKE